MKKKLAYFMFMLSVLFILFMLCSTYKKNK